MQRVSKQCEDWFSANIYDLAKKYAARNPVEGMDKEDYVQELVTRVWQALPKYDPEKSKLSTFAFMWFRSKKYELSDAIRRRYNAMGAIESFSDAVTESGCMVEDTVACPEPEYDVIDAGNAYSKIGLESRMYYEGYTIAQISAKLKKPMALIAEAIDCDVAMLREMFGVEVASV